MTMAPLWTLVLMVLPSLASSFPQSQDIGVCCNTKKRNVSGEKGGFFDTGKDSQVQVAGDEEEDQEWNYQPMRIKSHLSLYPVPKGYVCCNQPATRPPRPHGGKGHQGYALTKRDDDYLDLRRIIAQVISRLAESADRPDITPLAESADRPHITHLADSLDRLDDSVVVPSLPTASDDDNHISNILGDWELEDNDVVSSGFKKRFSGSGAGGMNMGG